MTKLHDIYVANLKDAENKFKLRIAHIKQSKTYNLKRFEAGKIDRDQYITFAKELDKYEMDSNNEYNKSLAEKPPELGDINAVKK